MTIGKLIIALGVDDSDLDRGLRRGIQRIENASRRVMAVGGALTLAVTTPIVGAGVASVNAAADLDRLERGLLAIVGSAEETEVQLERLKEVARLPGLGFKEAIQGSVNLQAVGFEAEQAERILKGFGNALAITGGGRAELDRVITQLTQMASAGRILTADLRPIIQTSPLVARALKEAFGTIDAQAIEELGLPFEVFFERLLSQLETLPPASAGASNSFENFEDSAFRAAAAIGDVLLPVVLPIIDGIADLAEKLADVDPKFIKFGIVVAGVAAIIGPLIGFVGLLGAAWVALAPIATALGLTVGALAGSLALIPVLFAALIAVGYGIVKNWDLISEKTKALYEGIKTWLVDKFNEEVAKIKKTVDTITGFFKGMYRAVVGRSYVPDMIVGIKNEMAQLERVMVAPAQAAASDVSRAMEALAVGPSSVTQIMDRYTSAIQHLRSLRMEAMFAQDAKAAKKLHEQIALLESEIRRMGNAVSVLNELQVTPRIVTGEVKTGRDLAGKETISALEASLQRMTERVNANAAAVNAEIVARGQNRFAMTSWALALNALENSLDAGKDELRFGFQDITRAMSPASFAFTFMQGVLEGLTPAIEALMEPVALVGELLGTVLAPIIEALAVPLRLLAKIATYVVTAIGWLIRAIGKAINWLLPGNPANGLVKFGQSMMDQAAATRRQLDATNKATEATERMTKSMSNVPSGYKLFQLRQYEAARPRYSSTPAAAAAGVGGVSVQYTMQPGAIVVQGANKPVRQLVDEMQAEIERRRRSTEGA